MKTYDDEDELNGDELGSAGGGLPPPPPRPPPSPSDVDGLDHPFFHGTGVHDQVDYSKIKKKLLQHIYKHIKILQPIKTQCTHKHAVSTPFSHVCNLISPTLKIIK